IFQQRSVRYADWTKAFWRHLRRSLEDEFPSICEAVVKDGIRQPSGRSPRMCGAKRLKFDLDFANVGNGRIRAIEGTIGCRWQCPSGCTNSDDGPGRDPSAHALGHDIPRMYQSDVSPGKRQTTAHARANDQPSFAAPPSPTP